MLKNKLKKNMNIAVSVIAKIQTAEAHNQLGLYLSSPKTGSVKTPAMRLH